MNLSLSLNDIYAMLATLTNDNKQWLADKLIQDVQAAKVEPKKQKTLKFPKIPKNRPISQEVLDMVVGKLPDDFDYDKEINDMYMERAMWNDNA